MTAGDPRDTIDRSPMSPFQWRVVAVMVGLNALDGFDVLSISFASPGIARAWAIDRGALGVVLSMELVGMAIGSLILGGVADRVGRRATILGCLAVMALGMFAAAASTGVAMLLAARAVTGIGIGGMLATTNAAVAEVASARRRALCVILMASGYPVGSVIGGSVTAALLTRHDWPVVFLFGGAATLCFIPLVLLAAPESIAFLAQRRRPGAVAAINRTLARMGHPPIDRLPDAPPAPAAVPVAALFSAGRAATTLLLTTAYFAHIVTFYFVLKWVPKIVGDMGFAPSAAAGVLVWASLGGLAGALSLGLLTLRAPVRTLTIGAMLLSAALVMAFGRPHAGLAGLSLAAAAAGFATNAGVVGLYALLAEAYPTATRATATGFVIGVGRGGSALAPALAGLLFVIGLGLLPVTAIMAAGSLIAAAALLAWRAGGSAAQRGA